MEKWKNQYFEELWWEHQKSGSLSILESSHTDHVEIIQDNCDIGFHVLSNIPNYLFYALEFAKNVPAATNLWHPDVENFLWKSEIRNSILESNIFLECLLASPPTFTFCLIASKQYSSLEEDKCSVGKENKQQQLLRSGSETSGLPKPMHPVMMIIRVVMIIIMMTIMRRRSKLGPSGLLNPMQPIPPWHL